MGSGHGLFAGFLGDTKQEGLGPNLVNSNTEELRRVGRTVRDGELPWLTASLPPTPSSTDEMWPSLSLGRRIAV